MQILKRFVRNLGQARILVPLAATLLWAASTLYMPSGITRAIVSIGFLTIVPGYVLYRLIAGYHRGDMPAKTIGYSVILSMIVMIVVGLGINQLLQLVGKTYPLTTRHIVYAIAATVATLSIGSAFRAHRPRKLRRYRLYSQLSFWRSKGMSFWLNVGLGVLLVLAPILAVGGATMLNNGGSSWLALLAMSLVALMILVLSWTNKVSRQVLYPLGLYSAALTILLGTSMRGWEITGHDIMQEFQVFQLTIQHSLWDMKFYQDAYTACLSITILPTILQKATGIYDPYIYKFLFQVIFAAMGPLLYSGLRSYVPRKTAFLAVLVFMTFPTFLTDIMMLNRQEIAIFCFAAALVASLDKNLNTFARHAIMVICLGGMVLSHYSTSYIAASVLIVATVIAAGLWVLRPWLVRFKLQALQDRGFGIFPPYIVALTIVMVVGWSGLATHTGGNIAQTISNIGTAAIRIVNPHAVPAKQSEPVNAADSSLKQYIDSVQYNRPLATPDYYADARQAQYEPLEVPQQNAPVTPAVQAFGISGDVLSAVYDLVRQGYVAVLALLLAVGLAIMALKQTATRLPVQYALLGIASLVVVVLQVVLPSDAVNYGLARVIQQSLVILALPAVIACEWLLGKLKVAFQMRFRVIGVGLVVLFLLLSSILSTLTGGFKPALAFGNSGFYYEAYYTHPDEIAAGKWLVENTPKGSRVYADEFSRRKLITYAGIFAQPTLVPGAIPIDSYVYLSNGNTSFNEVPVYYHGELLLYSLPRYFLDTHKTLVYSSGSVRIYK